MYNVVHIRTVCLANFKFFEIFTDCQAVSDVSSAIYSTF